MKRLWGRAMAGAIVAALSAALAPACAHNDSTLFVYDVLAPQIVTVGTRCLFTSSVSQPALSEGSVDTALTNGYFAEFLLGNQMVAQANPSQGKTETSIIEVQGAVVTIKDETGSQVLAQYTYNATTTVPPASGGTPGFAPIGALIINESTLANYGPPINDRLLTFTHFFGVTLGGQSVTSNEFEFPVNLCSGCLVTFSAADISPTCQNVNCVGTGQAAPTSVPCYIGQDVAVDCALCQGIKACSPECIPVGPDDAGGPDASGTSSSSSSGSPPVPEAGSPDSGLDASDSSVDTGTSDASGDGTTSDANLDATAD